MRMYVCLVRAPMSLQVVHIDLGIAFEQGLFLQTPERVPFRLTNNIVDGMGAAGVEGTFRRCCETALQVGGAGSQGTGTWWYVSIVITARQRGSGPVESCTSRPAPVRRAR